MSLSGVSPWFFAFTAGVIAAFLVVILTCLLLPSRQSGVYDRDSYDAGISFLGSKLSEVKALARALEAEFKHSDALDKTLLATEATLKAAVEEIETLRARALELNGQAAGSNAELLPVHRDSKGRYARLGDLEQRV